MKQQDDEICQGVYDATLKEVEQGWLEGPIPLTEMGDRCSVTRRFGVKQFSTEADGSRSCKVRPIDDFTESLINLTNGSEECIVVHGIDFILAGVAYRMGQMRACGGASSELCAKTVDLRKAYKQLPIDANSLHDSYLCVKVPSERRVELYRCKVLPFGARAAVSGFCRTSHAIWAIGTSLFKLHWSCYFDDYFVVEKSSLKRHTSFIVDNLFSLLGWETSSEKNAEFNSLARALGVVFDFGETHLASMVVRNSEQRCLEIAGLIDAIITNKRWTKAELETLRGRLIFVESQIYGRAAHRALKEITHALCSSSKGSVSNQLKAALTFLKDRVLTAPPKKLRCVDREVLHLYTDACFEHDMSGLGGVLYRSSGEAVEFFSHMLKIKST